MIKNSSKKRLYFTLSLLFIIGAVLTLEFTNMTHFFHKAAVVRAPQKTTITSPKKIESQNNIVNKDPATRSSTAEGAATDKNGQIPSNTPNDPSQWSTSSSRLITVKLPYANSTFKPGDTITGSTDFNSVQYRLIDDTAGVIAQGAITVVNGNFTASVTFKSYSSTGRLDIFNYDPDGKEANGVQIPIKY